MTHVGHIFLGIDGVYLVYHFFGLSLSCLVCGWGLRQGKGTWCFYTIIFFSSQINIAYINSLDRNFLNICVRYKGFYEMGWTMIFWVVERNIWFWPALYALMPAEIAVERLDLISWPSWSVIHFFSFSLFECAWTVDWSLLQVEHNLDSLVYEVDE